MFIAERIEGSYYLTSSITAHRDLEKEQVEEAFGTFGTEVTEI